MRTKYPSPVLVPGIRWYLCILFLTTIIYPCFSQTTTTTIITRDHADKKDTLSETYFIRQNPVLPNDPTRKAGKRIIVEFFGEPLAALYKKNLDKQDLKAQIQLLRAQQNKQFDDFRRDLNALYKSGCLSIHVT